MNLMLIIRFENLSILYQLLRQYAVLKKIVKFYAHISLQNMLHLTEGDIRSLGVKNPAHRAHISSGLVILREKLKYSECVSIYNIHFVSYGEK